MNETYLRVKLLLIGALLLFSSCFQSSHSKKEASKVQKAIKIVEKRKVDSQRGKIPTVNISEFDKIKSPLSVEVNSQGLWFASEGRLGSVSLIDENGIEIANEHLMTKNNWMTKEPVVFNATLQFTTKEGTQGQIIIYNDPGEGDGKEAGEKINFSIPIIYE